MAVCAAAQQSTHAVNQVYSIQNAQGVVIQYEASILSGFFYPGKELSKFALKCPDNCVLLQTSYGTHELYFMSHKGACAAGCTYQASFDTYSQNQTTGSLFFYDVQGTLTGTFTDPTGIVYPNTLARFHFETIPASWLDEKLLDLAAGLGTLDIVLQLD